MHDYFTSDVGRKKGGWYLRNTKSTVSQSVLWVLLTDAFIDRSGYGYGIYHQYGKRWDDSHQINKKMAVIEIADKSEKLES